MPGMSANLTDGAFAIWKSIRKKEAGEKPIYNNNNQGRSYWLSNVIIQHEGWVEKYNALISERHDLQNSLNQALETINDLQKRIHE